MILQEILSLISGFKQIFQKDEWWCILPHVYKVEWNPLMKSNHRWEGPTLLFSWDKKLCTIDFCIDQTNTILFSATSKSSTEYFSKYNI